MTPPANRVSDTTKTCNEGHERFAFVFVAFIIHALDKYIC
jgi:hypothetical protein